MPDRVIELRVARSPRAGVLRRPLDTYRVAVDPERDSVLDLLERVWADHDPTLVFRHACHHASCGTCAIRVDGREVLPCVTIVGDVWDGRSPLRVEPLRGVPVVADVAVDPSAALQRLASLRFPYVRAVEEAVRACAVPAGDADVGAAERFEDCLECLACVSACPVSSADPQYLGPAFLAAADRIVEDGDPPDHAHHVLALVDTDHGVWQCRSILACSAVCPSGVDPAARIMDLRRRVLVAS